MVEFKKISEKLSAKLAKLFESLQFMIFSFLILSFSISLVVLSILGFFLNQSILSAYVPLALMMAGVLMFFQFRPELKSFLKSFLTFLVALSLAALAANSLTDFSGDGLGYHMNSVLLLAQGWNPITSPFISQAVGGGRYDVINHFPKALWIMGACICKSTSSLEMGKLFELLFAFMTFSLAREFVKKIGVISERDQVILAILASLNPVVLVQLKSFYVDGALASLLTCFIILALKYLLTKERVSLVLLGMITLILVNLKYTGMVYCLFLWGIIWCFESIRAKKFPAQISLWMGLSVTGAIFWIGYQPYVTNLVYLKSFFYVPSITCETPQIRIKKALGSPVDNQSSLIGHDLTGAQPNLQSGAGGVRRYEIEHGRPWEETVEFSQSMAAPPRATKKYLQNLMHAWGFPMEFIEKSRLEKLLYLFFSKSENDPGRLPKLKIPFFLYKTELIAFSETDTRYGGFGPFFGLTLLVVIGVLLLYFNSISFPFSLRGDVIWYASFLVVVVVSALIVPEPWWARLVPQLWLIPLTFLTYLSAKTLIRSLAWGRTLVFLTLAVNNLFVFSTCYSAQMIREIDFHRATAYLKTISHDHSLAIKFKSYSMVNEYRLAHAGVNYIAVSTIATPSFLEFTVVPYDMIVAQPGDKNFHFDYRGLIEIYRERFKKTLKTGY